MPFHTDSLPLPKQAVFIEHMLPRKDLQAFISVRCVCPVAGPPGAGVAPPLCSRVGFE